MDAGGHVEIVKQLSHRTCWSQAVCACHSGCMTPPIRLYDYQNYLLRCIIRYSKYVHYPINRLSTRSAHIIRRRYMKRARYFTVYLLWWFLIIIGLVILINSYQFITHNNQLEAIRLVISGFGCISLGIGGLIIKSRGELGKLFQLLGILLFIIRGLVLYFKVFHL